MWKLFDQRKSWNFTLFRAWSLLCIKRPLTGKSVLRLLKKKWRCSSAFKKTFQYVQQELSNNGCFWARKENYSTGKKKTCKSLCNTLWKNDDIHNLETLIYSIVVGEKKKLWLFNILHWRFALNNDLLTVLHSSVLLRHLFIFFPLASVERPKTRLILKAYEWKLHRNLPSQKELCH